jgi:hypothetical protein
MPASRRHRWSVSFAEDCQVWPPTPRSRLGAIPLSCTAMRRPILAGVLALAACGPPLPPSHPLGTTDPDDEVVCQDERSTGTNMSRSVCHTKSQIEENRRAAQQWQKTRDLQSPSPPK